LERGFGVTLIAAIQVRRARELTVVRIYVAIDAERKSDLVQRRAARRDVALRADDTRVRQPQRELRLIVFGNGER
jgi:hypothetical protein